MSVIYPFSPYKKQTWRNWSNYLVWINNSINSLQDYLDYFNPNFYILNETLQYKSSNNWKTINSDIVSTKKCWYPFRWIKKIGSHGIKKSDIMYFCLPGKLRWREGILNPNIVAYACFDISYFPDFDETTAIDIDASEEATKIYQLNYEDWKAALNKQHFYEIPQSTVIFSKKWTHSGLFTYNNSQTQDINNYQFISLPIAALYIVNSIENGLRLRYFKNGQRALGENLSFTLELSPGRYFHTKNGDNKWISKGVSYTTQGAYWSKNDAPMQSIITNQNNQVWTNSYPLMHECRIANNTELYPTEEFIFDQSFDASEINIANHSTVLYTINANNITEKETESWNDFVRVSIL